MRDVNSIHLLSPPLIRGKRRPQKTSWFLMSILIICRPRRISPSIALTSSLRLSIERLLNTDIGDVSPIYTDVIKQAEVISWQNAVVYNEKLHRRHCCGWLWPNRRQYSPDLNPCLSILPLGFIYITAALLTRFWKFHKKKVIGKVNECARS